MRFCLLLLESKSNKQLNSGVSGCEHAFRPPQGLCIQMHHYLSEFNRVVPNSGMVQMRQLLFCFPMVYFSVHCRAVFAMQQTLALNQPMGT
jgi:hypothetical protein